MGTPELPGECSSENTAARAIHRHEKVKEHKKITARERAREVEIEKECEKIEGAMGYKEYMEEEQGTEGAENAGGIRMPH